MPVAVVMEWKIGNTRMKIDNEACEKTTEEEIERILRRIMARADCILPEGEETQDG